MPNWCRNELEINGDASEIAKLLEDAKPTGEKGEEFSIAKLVPIPDEVQQDGDAWYNWAVKNWGTKWDLSDVNVDNQGKFAYLKFETAWAPPVEAFTTISKQYPSLSFKLSYVEEGNDFMGVATFEDGLIEQHDKSFSDNSSVTIVFSFQDTKVKDGYIQVPVTITAPEDKYEMDSEMETTEVIMTFPEDFEIKDLDVMFYDQVKFGETEDIEDDSMNNFVGENEDEMKEAIIENFEEIKKCAQANKLDKELPSKKSKSHKYKL